MSNENDYRERLPERHVPMDERDRSDMARLTAGHDAALHDLMGRELGYEFDPRAIARARH